MITIIIIVGLIILIRVYLLELSYKESTDSWWFGLLLNSFNDNGDNDVSDYNKESRLYTNSLILITPWTFRTYKLKRNIIGVRFNYEYKGYNNYSSAEYGVSFLKSSGIHTHWNTYEVDHCQTGYLRIYELPFTQKTRRVNKLLNLDKTVFADYEYELLESVEKATYKAVDYDGEKIEIECYLEYNVYTFYKNKVISYFTKLFNLDEEFIRLEMEFKSKDGVGIDKDSWKGGITGTSIRMKPDESVFNALLRYCEKNDITLAKDKLC